LSPRSAAPPTPDALRNLVERNIPAAARPAVAALHALNRLGEPQEVADLAAWLCSVPASFTTGNYYAVGGGLLAQDAAMG
jgi:NAD(P)-dependent dehydrogenase (short-subunit alcohol dehydrogenase family)